MSWAEVKKINDNMSISLDQLFTQFLAGGMREYIYETRNYTVPFDGVYTIRAFCGHDGSYGKLVRKCKKGEILTITMTNNAAIEITSNLEGTAAFHINLTKDSYVNGNSANGIKGIAIGGAFLDTDGGNAYIRCNNGIAAGGGGSGGNSNATVNGYNGGSAYAYGNNVYALGGGGGGGGNHNASLGGLGGAAYINGTALVGYCSVTSLESGKGYDGVNGYNAGTTSYGGVGGNGGCGGGAGYRRTCSNRAAGSTWQVGGFGYFSDGGTPEGGSARGGNWDSMGTNCNSNSSTANVVRNSGPYPVKGYFVGGGMPSYRDAGGMFIGGTGGFLGGKGLSTNSNAQVGRGGYSPYGFGGTGGDINGLSNGIGADGGDGRIMGGNGGAGNGAAGHQGNGGNGYYPGSGYINGIAMTNNMLIGTAPLKGMTEDTSIVIIEYGDSPEDF